VWWQTRHTRDRRTSRCDRTTRNSREHLRAFAILRKAIGISSALRRRRKTFRPTVPVAGSSSPSRVSYFAHEVVFREEYTCHLFVDEALSTAWSKSSL
jgi:hypothetical protein